MNTTLRGLNRTLVANPLAVGREARAATFVTGFIRSSTKLVSVYSMSTLGLVLLTPIWRADRS